MLSVVGAGSVLAATEAATEVNLKGVLDGDEDVTEG